MIYINQMINCENMAAHTMTQYFSILIILAGMPEYDFAM